ncbi:MAG: hypothetical protein ABF301_04855, partial [Sulfurovum sp.]
AVAAKAGVDTVGITVNENGQDVAVTGIAINSLAGTAAGTAVNTGSYAYEATKSLLSSRKLQFKT